MKKLSEKIFVRTKKPLKFRRRAAEGYIDTAVKILIAVVLGALLLGLLYALFKDTIMPTVTQKITEMFSYAGGLT